MNKVEKSPNLEILQKSKIFQDLTMEDILLVCKITSPEIMIIKKDKELWRLGDIINSIDILEEGIMVSQKYHIDGRVQLVSTYNPSSLVNIEATVSYRLTSPVFIIASTDCKIVRFNYNLLVHNRNIPVRIRFTIFDNIAAYLATGSVRNMNTSYILSRRKVKDRVLTYLNIMRYRTESDSFNIGMSREELAQYLCVDRTSLSEALNELKREGQIKFKKADYVLLFKDYEHFI